MIRFFFICLGFLLIGIIVQQWIYSLDFAFMGGRALITPLLFICIAQAQRYTATLVFAFLTGLIWDADHCLGALSSSPAPEIAPILENLRYGYSIVLFGLIGFLIKLTQSLIPLRGLIINTLLTLFFFHLYLILESSLFFFIRGSIPENWEILTHISKISILSTIPAPLVLYLLGISWKALKSTETGYAVGLVSLIHKEPRS